MKFGDAKTPNKKNVCRLKQSYMGHMGIHNAYGPTVC